MHVLRLVSYVSPRNARIDNNYRASDMQVCCRLLAAGCCRCPGLSRNLASDTRHQQPVIRTSLLDIILPVSGRSSMVTTILPSINLVISMHSCITCKFNFPCWLKGPIIMLQTAEEWRNDIKKWWGTYSSWCIYLVCASECVALPCHEAQWCLGVWKQDLRSRSEPESHRSSNKFLRR